MISTNINFSNQIFHRYLTVVFLKNYRFSKILQVAKMRVSYTLHTLYKVHLCVCCSITRFSSFLLLRATIYLLCHAGYSASLILDSILIPFNNLHSSQFIVQSYLNSSIVNHVMHIVLPVGGRSLSY